MKTLLAAFAVLAIATSAQAQSCYSQAFGAPVAYQQPVGLATNFCGAAQVQTHVVNVPVEIQTQTVAVPVQTQVAVPTCAAQSFATSYAVPVAVAVPAYSVGFSAGYGFNAGFNTAFAPYRTGFVNTGFVNRGFAFNRFGAVGATGVGNVALSAVDRRCTQVQAVGVNNVRVNRGLLGRINSVQADGRPPGLLGRLGL